jgi:hypothetical protein
MIRFVLTCCLACIMTWSKAQPQQISLGVFSGITAPFTWDEGINSDSRYEARYDVKLAPIGISYSIDFKHMGLVLTPSLISIGQNFHVVNTVGGNEGLRRIDMQYLTIPIALKVHVIDLSFFKISLIGGAAMSYLLKGEESISHNHAKFRFPPLVYPVLPSEYIIEYDGIIAPKVDDHTMLTKSDYNSLQCFVSAGFRSDWDVSEKWRISLDMRGNYGLAETRSDAYLQKASAYQQQYDIAGKRREIFASLNIGIARYVEVDKDNRKKSSKKYSPKKYPWVAPNRGRPRG